MKPNLRTFLKKLGPGLITGAADDDPSGIATYSQAGAGSGFSMLCAALFTLPLMITVQEVCARIGLVTGRGIITNLRLRRSKPLVIATVALLALANTINVGADLGMMAAAFRLLAPVPTWMLLVAFAGLTLVLEIFLTYKVYARYLKWLTVSLFSYVLVAFCVHIDWWHALKSTFLPSVVLTKDYLMIFVAFLGTTISPYLFFWQANQEVEDGKKKIKDMRIDVYAGMIFSNLASWFIVLTAASVLWTNGLRDIQSADQAAAVLAPLAGQFASTLFAIGIIGVGLLALPVLAGSVAYAVCEAVVAPEGLDKKWYDAKYFYGVLVGVIVIGLLLNVFGVNPVKALIWSAVCNAIVAVPLMYVIQNLANDHKLMGKHVNGRLTNIVFWIALAVMALASLAWLIVSVV